MTDYTFFSHSESFVTYLTSIIVLSGVGSWVVVTVLIFTFPSPTYFLKFFQSFSILEIGSFLCWNFAIFFGNFNLYWSTFLYNLFETDFIQSIKGG